MISEIHVILILNKMERSLSMKKTPIPNKTIFVAVDGSEASTLCYSVAAYNFIGKKDKIVVAHIYNPDKTFLPFAWTGSALRKIYETELLSHFHHSRYKMAWEQNNENVTTK
jgi:hypothetical protein